MTMPACLHVTQPLSKCSSITNAVARAVCLNRDFWCHRRTAATVDRAVWQGSSVQGEDARDSPGQPGYEAV